MIEYLTNTNLANSKLGRIQGTFGWAGKNAEYAKLWRKKIADSQMTWLERSVDEAINCGRSC